MTYDLRAWAEGVIERISDPMSGHFYSLPGDRTRYTLAHAVLTLLGEKEAAEHRAEKAEAALGRLMKRVWYIVGSNPAGWTDDEVTNQELLCALKSLKVAFHTLEGREEKS